MLPTGLHLLLTYRCTFECDHCFVWSGPGRPGTMTLATIRAFLDQAEALGTVEWIYFEGGEPFLYYAGLKRAVTLAAERGFRVGLVSNGYWAVDVEDAEEALRPFAGRVQDLSLSHDAYHGSDEDPTCVLNAKRAAERLGIPVGLIEVAAPDETVADEPKGQLPAGRAPLMFRGRAATILAPKVAGRPAESFTRCPYEDLIDPDRVHVDPFGHVFLCQGISLGNLFETPLKRLCETYEPLQHPVLGPLIEGGPLELARLHGVSTEGAYADACHLCDATRRRLRERYPAVLTPDQVYGVD
jgi:MoaA/NifB/PqqE/SkfB family radical SAM enzyme